MTFDKLFAIGDTLFASFLLRGLDKTLQPRGSPRGVLRSGGLQLIAGAGAQRSEPDGCERVEVRPFIERERTVFSEWRTTPDYGELRQGGGA